MIQNLQIALVKNVLNNNDQTIIEHLYKLTKLEELINIKIFSTNNKILLNNSYPILPLYEAKYTKDIIIVWDLLSLELVLDFPNTQHIIYLQLDELPWISHEYILYENWEKFFDNAKISIVTDNQDTNQIISSTWSKPIYFIDKFNLKEFYEILRSKR